MDRKCEDMDEVVGASSVARFRIRCWTMFRRDFR